MIKVLVVVLICLCSITAVRTYAAPNQGNTTLIYHQAGLAAYEGNYSGALSLYKKILKIDPYDSGVLGGIGRILYSLNNYTGVVQYLDKALSIDPKNVYDLDGKGLALYKLNNYTGALSVLNEGLWDVRQ